MYTRYSVIYIYIKFDNIIIIIIIIIVVITACFLTLTANSNIFFPFLVKLVQQHSEKTVLTH